MCVRCALTSQIAMCRIGEHSIEYISMCSSGNLGNQIYGLFEIYGNEASSIYYSICCNLNQSNQSKNHLIATIVLSLLDMFIICKHVHRLELWNSFKFWIGVST